MRTLRSGNEYALIKPYTTEDGKAIPMGQICQYSEGYLATYDSTRTFVKFKAELVPDEILLLYNEAPYNREYRERRERIATAAMQSMLGGIMQSTLMMEQYARRAANEGFKSLGALVAHDSVGFANDLIDELKRIGD